MSALLRCPRADELVTLRTDLDLVGEGWKDRPAIPTAAQYVDIGNLITAAGGRNYLPYLRVTAVLNPSADGLQAPTLTNMGLQFGCVDSE